MVRWITLHHRSMNDPSITQSIHFWQTFIPLHEQQVLAWPYYSIAVGNILLNGLNLIWWVCAFLELSQV